MELEQIDNLTSKTNEELIELVITLIKTLYHKRPKQGFRLESGIFVKDSEHYFKSFKSYLTKPNNIRSHEAGNINQDWLKWFEKLQQLKSQCHERNRKF